MLAWVTNMSTSPDLNIEFSTNSTRTDPQASRNIFYEAINSEQRLVMEKANPLLESFGEPPRTRMTNSSCPPTDLKEKGNPDMPSVCSNYWPPIVALSLCFNHLVLWTFRQCRSAIPKRSAKSIASIHHTVEYPQRNPDIPSYKYITTFTIFRAQMVYFTSDKKKTQLHFTAINLMTEKQSRNQEHKMS